jgi:hypothetical protein
MNNNVLSVLIPAFNEEKTPILNGQADVVYA